MVTKLQQGGQMNDEQELFSAYLIKLFKPKSQQEFEDTISKLSEQQISEIYKQFKSMENNQTIMAKMGAKIDYISRLQGKCPEGYEVEKFMAGGCVKCRKRAMAEDSKAMDIFKDKCGGKAKRRIKKNENGDKVTVNKTDTVHTSKGVYNVSNKKLPYKKMSKVDYKGLPLKDKMKVDMKDQANGRGASGSGSTKGSNIGKKLNGGTISSFKCGGMAKKRIKKNMGGTVSNKWSIPSKANGDAIKHIKGGPGSADSTREMKLNGFQKKALAGRSYKSK